MTRIFTDGAEFGDLAFFDITSNVTAATDQKRTGVYSYKTSTTSGSSATKNITAVSEGFWRFGWYTSSTIEAGKVFVWLNSATELGSLRINTTGLLEVYVGTGLVNTGEHNIIANTWYLIEVHVKIADAGGVIEVKVDGVSDSTFNGDTKPGADTQINVLKYRIASGNHNEWFDDLAMNDTNGSSDNSWCGEGKVILMTPNGNGDVSQLVGQDSNSVDNYLNVDDIPSDSDTTYNQSSTLNERDLYKLTDTGLSSVTILRVIPEGRAKDTVAVGGLASLIIKVSGAGEYDGPDRSLLTTYYPTLGSGYVLNPYTNATWEITELDGLQVGFKVRS